MYEKLCQVIYEYFMLSFTTMSYNFRLSCKEKNDVRRRGPDWARGLSVLWAGAANAGPALPGLVVLTADRARRPTWTWNFDSPTGSPLGLTNPNAGCGGRRSPSGARWAAAVRGLAGRRATGPGSYGREDTPCAAAGRTRRAVAGRADRPRGQVKL
jgi:hypothetical protein